MPIADGSDNASDYTWLPNVASTTYGVTDRVTVLDGETVNFALNDGESAYVRFLDDLTNAPTINAGTGNLLDEDGNALAAPLTEAGVYMLIQEGINTRVYPFGANVTGATLDYTSQNW